MNMPMAQQNTKRKFTLLAEKQLPVAVLLLCCFSVLAIGASMNKPLVGDERWIDRVILFLQANYVGLQMLWSVGGLVLMLAVSFLPYRYYKKYANAIYWGNIVLLVLVLLVGDERNGTTGWLKIGFLQNLLGDRTIQPSEIAKIALILTLSRQIAACKGEIRSLQQVLPLVLSFALPFVLILLQPDFGTAMVYLVVFVVLLFVGGLNWRYFVGALGLAGAAVPLLWFFVFGDVQRNRILTFLNPAIDPDAAYQITQSRRAIGSGGLFGKGLFDTGSMGQLNFLPEKHTDFIFAIIGEAFGFIGVLALLALFVWLLARILLLATRCQDAFGRLISVGVLALLVAHIFENIGMTMGVMPITGIPLPFISYGGSAMLANMVMMGILLSVARYQPQPQPQRLDRGKLLRINPWARQRRLPTVE